TAELRARERRRVTHTGAGQGSAPTESPIRGPGPHAAGGGPPTVPRSLPLAQGQSAAHPVPDRGGAGLEHPGGLRRLGDHRRLHVPVGPGLGGEDPHVALVRQGRDDVHQPVDEVSVPFSPPQQDGVDDLVRVLLQEFGPDGVLDGLTDRRVTVGIPSDLLDDHVLRQFEQTAHLVRSVLLVRRGDHRVVPPSCPGLASRSFVDQEHYPRAVPGDTPTVHFRPRRALPCRTSRFGAQSGVDVDRPRNPLRARVPPDTHPRGHGGPTPCRGPTGSRAERHAESRTRRMTENDGNRAGSAPTNVPVLREGVASYLADSDPEETQEWMDSLDGLLAEAGPERARYLMLRLLERASKQRVPLPPITSTDYVNSIPTQLEPEFPGDESVERTYRRWIRWNAAIMVHRAQRPGVGVGGHISTYAGAAPLYEVGYNHFFRGKDHPGGGDHVFFQGHASPGMYARAYLEGRLREHDLDGFRQEKSHPGRSLPSYPHPRCLPEFWEFPTVSMGLGP